VVDVRWHDALAVPLWKHKVVPPLPDGRTTPTGQGHYQKWGVWRKHEAESMYVANSKPAYGVGEKDEQA